MSASRRLRRVLSPILLSLLLGLLIISLLATAGQQPSVLAQDEAATLTPTPIRNTLLVVDAFVRSGPGNSYVEVGRVTPDSVLLPLNQSEDGLWVLIRYHRGFGWLRRDLAYWVINIDALPVLSTAELTPTVPIGAPTATAFFPTSTPTGDYINVSANSAYVRAGPGRTYLRLGQLYSGDPIEPVSRNADTTWVMIRFDDGFGWINRGLGVWTTDLETLPVMVPLRLTPSATFTPSQTPSTTATASATETATETATSTATPSDTPTNTPTETATETATHTATATITPSHTPTPTATSSPTETPAPTLTETPLPTETSTLTATVTPAPSETLSPTDTPTITASPTDTATVTQAPSETATPEPPTATETATSTPTQTPTASSSPTPAPTETEAITVTERSPLIVASPTDAETATEIATETATEVAPSDTPVPPSETPVPPSVEPGELTLTPDSAAILATSAAIATGAAESTDTGTVSSATEDMEATQVAAQVSTQTDIPTEEASTETISPTTTAESTEAVEPTPEETPTEETGIVIAGTASTDDTASTETPPAPSTPSSDDPSAVSVESDAGRFPIEAVVGGLALLLILGYIVLYLRGLNAVNRYANGFVIDQCPVCRRGELIVENNPKRTLGIPGTRRTVRCTNCRSVLREVGEHRWRYAVDRIENVPLYDRLNNREVDEETLRLLLENPVEGGRPDAQIDFIDEERS